MYFPRACEWNNFKQKFYKCMDNRYSRPQHAVILFNDDKQTFLAYITNFPVLIHKYLQKNATARNSVNSEPNATIFEMAGWICRASIILNFEDHSLICFEDINKFI